MGTAFALLLQVLGIVNLGVSTMKNAQGAFSGKKGSGAKKKKLVTDVVKQSIAKTKLTKKEQAMFLKEMSKTIDNVKDVANVIHDLKQ